MPDSTAGRRLRRRPHLVPSFACGCADSFNASKQDLAVQRAETEAANRYVRSATATTRWGGSTPTCRHTSSRRSRAPASARRPASPRRTTPAPSPSAKQTCSPPGAPCSEATATLLDAHIAVTIDADVLAGADPTASPSLPMAGGPSPVGWITGAVRRRQRLLAPHRAAARHRGCVVARIFGRFSPDVLDIALRFAAAYVRPRLHGPGLALVIDHRGPWPAGHTSGANLGPLCRRHHIVQGPRRAALVVGPPQAPPAPVVIEIYPQPVFMALAA